MNEIIKTVAPYLIILAVAYFLYRKIFNKAEDEARVKEHENNLVTKAREKGILLTKGNHPPSAYKDFATALYNAMDGVGTDVNRILQTFSKLHNDFDVLATIEAFGIRGEQDLAAWLANDLDSSRIAQINEYLRKSKIKYQF